MPKVTKMNLYIFVISLEKHGNEVDVFLPADNHKHFLQVESITLGVLATHAPSIQNKFTVSLKYLKENANDEWSLQSDITILDVYDQTCPNYSK